MKSIPRRYFYLDDEGIESLYAQAVSRVETERIATSGEGRKSRLAGKVGLGSIGSLFGLLDFKGEADSTTSTDSSDTIKSSFSIEQKLQSLVGSLRKIGNPYFCTDLKSASEILNNDSNNVFVDLSLEFDVPSFYGEVNINKINQAGYIVFEKDFPRNSHYDYSDNYFKNVRIPVVMSASLKKFPSCKGKLSPTGHEEIFFRSCAGINVPINVFGSVYRLPEFLQIKPYAIWL